jgi:hypothetical protein
MIFMLLPLKLTLKAQAGGWRLQLQALRFDYSSAMAYSKVKLRKTWYIHASDNFEHTTYCKSLFPLSLSLPSLSPPSLSLPSLSLPSLSPPLSLSIPLSLSLSLSVQRDSPNCA